MAIEGTLLRSIEHIRSGNVISEASIKQSVILPVLRALGWDDSNPLEFIPELRVGHDEGLGYVDYALCPGDRKPWVFIEAKRLGNTADSGVEQAFRYATNQGVPFLVLTDGNVWDFYLSMAEGIPVERRFYSIELQRDDGKLTDHAQFFEKYLSRNRVGLLETKRAAEDLLEGDLQKEKARNAIPSVWRELLGDPDETICSLIADGVQRECGTRPELDDVEAFLKNVLTTSASSSPTPEDSTTSTFDQRSVPPIPPPSTGRKIVGLSLDGRSTETTAANQTLAKLVKELQRRNPGFIGHFAARTSGRTRRLVSQTRDGLYDQAHLRVYAIPLENGWWLGTNISTAQVRKYIGIACEVAGVPFGSRLTLIER